LDFEEYRLYRKKEYEKELKIKQKELIEEAEKIKYIFEDIEVQHIHKQKF
jgi:hypothetical protein